MIFVWLIIALGVLVFLAEVGEGLKIYLSNKNPIKEENKDESELVS